jgi:selT/selW/selH-like putative selenoprotein
VQVHDALRQRFGPELAVTLENHPPIPIKAATARVVTLIQYSIMAFVLVGQQACQVLGIRLSTEFWTQVQEKRWSVLMGAWFIGNTVVNGLVSTGAFEIWYGSDVVFSKLVMGRMPTMEEIMNGVQEAMSASQ